MEPIGKKYGVFISYSHHDEPLISPIVQLLSVNRKDLVFQDKKHIEPGRKWGDELDVALSQADAIIVFWCLHSSRSEEVKKEYSFAISQGKSVIPVLLDKTEISDRLSEYQWIDFTTIRLHQNMFDEEGKIIPKKMYPPLESRKEKISPWPMIIVLGVVCLLILAMYLWGILNVLIVVGAIIGGIIAFVYIRNYFDLRELRKMGGSDIDTGPQYRRVPPDIDLAFRILDKLDEIFPPSSSE